jgi:hypothetical protein
MSVRCQSFVGLGKEEKPELRAVARSDAEEMSALPDVRYHICLFAMAVRTSGIAGEMTGYSQIMDR